MVNSEMTTEISILRNNKEVIGRGRITEDVIHDLDVELKYRRHGIATEIVRKLIGLGGRQLFVHAKNVPAIRLYQKLGFKIKEADSGFLKMILVGNAYPHDTVDYVKALEEIPTKQDLLKGEWQLHGGEENE